MASAPRHWPEYAIEAAALGTFMVSASLFAVLIEHPEGWLRQTVASDVARRLLMGLAMGATAIAIIYSPFGARSGAHMNPATTITFLRLGRMAPRDAAAYVAAQFAGGVLGMGVAAALLAPWIGAPGIDFVATRPGPAGPAVAFVAEAGISFGLMLTVLLLSNGPRARWTGVAAGALVALYILVEAPLSGMSMNPARSFAPAMLAGSLDIFWIYLLAPLSGMALAAEVFVRWRGVGAVLCARLNHTGTARCIFHCRMGGDMNVRRAA